METRHIKLNFNEAIFAKKQILSSELNILYLMKRLRNYRLLRKKEFTTKNKLKSDLTTLRNKLNLIISSFPVEESKVKIHIKHDMSLRRRRERREEIQNELEDIKTKLARLG